MDVAEVTSYRAGLEEMSTSGDSKGRHPGTTLITLSAAADYLRTPVSWIRRRVEEGTLSLVFRDGTPMLSELEVENLGGSDLYWHYKDDEHEQSLEQPFVPSRLRDYHPYHQALNEFTWLLKAFYTPRDQLRRSRFRLDHLFHYYLQQVPPGAQISKLLFRRHALSPAGIERACESLKKVWYNELGYVTPQLDSPLLLDSRGVTENIARSADRLAFPSWRMTQAYYVAYHAGRALADFCGLNYREQEHHAPMRAFKASKWSPATKTLFFFPFDLAARTEPEPFSTRNILSRIPHLKYKYAAHPRPPRRSFEETGQAVLAAFHRGRDANWSARSSGEPYLITDLLYQLRVWANYVDVENIVALKSSGLRAYLDLDLHTLTFFLAGIVELIALARLGGKSVILLAQEFHHDFVKGDDLLWRGAALHPLTLRFSIYEHTGRLEGLQWQPELPKPVALELLP